ncbi:MAG TPA: SpoIVB peptidase S55 domain-containing protein [Gemmataceae bacterium]|nr:SpoIVB peptidase S55 domain-containing protein [Gemmataceae bacterium]
MTSPIRLGFVLMLTLACWTCGGVLALAAPKPDSYWQVDDIRAGMKGVGRTVMKGTKIETFQAEVLGVLKNTSPGRDMVICRLSGLNLEKTGVIAGMSGSPVYIENKLVGAVAYAWPYGKEPIAGVTPFSQMNGFVEAFERRDLAEHGKPTRVGLRQPLVIDGKEFDTVTVSQGFDEGPLTQPSPPLGGEGRVRGAADGLWMMPLRTPLSATGFTRNSLKLLQERCGKFGMTPMQGGAIPGRIAAEEKDAPLEPGSPLAVSMIRGDFDLSGIGTVTHVEGKRVYGWGHPFMSLGSCEFPLMSGYIITVYPRQTVSFKMGAPLKPLGVINADVSTCIAGWLGRKADMLPVRMTVELGAENKARTYNVEIARQRTMMPALVFTALSNSVDMEGELPEEMTAELQARVEIEGHDPLIINDTFSGFSGNRAPQALYSQVGAVINILTRNAFKPVRIQRIDCRTQVRSGRRTADIEAVELASDAYEPGETVKATVFLRPYKGVRQRVPVTLKLPIDLPEGPYVATICDDLLNARLSLRENPTLNNPTNLDQVFEAVRVQTSVKRTNLVMRMPVADAGVALSGKALPHLPPSMVQILGNGRRTGAQTMSSALVSRQPTDWVIQGSEIVRFSVVRHKKAQE